jgi:hypothetical protein
MEFALNLSQARIRVNKKLQDILDRHETQSLLSQLTPFSDLVPFDITIGCTARDDNITN